MAPSSTKPKTPTASASLVLPQWHLLLGATVYLLGASIYLPDVCRRCAYGLFTYYLPGPSCGGTKTRTNGLGGLVPVEHGSCMTAAVPWHSALSAFGAVYCHRARCHAGCAGGRSCCYYVPMQNCGTLEHKTGHKKRQRKQSAHLSGANCKLHGPIWLVSTYLVQRGTARAQNVPRLWKSP